MKKLAFMVFCIFLFSSCKKEMESVIKEPKDVYVFQDIKYFLGEGDGLKIDTVSIYSKEFFNTTSTDTSLSLDSLEQAETSQFFIKEESSFTLRINDSLKICVPVLVSDGKIFTGNKKWEYSETEKETLSTSSYTSTFSLTAHTKCTIEIYAIRRNISTSYIATYIAEKTGEVLEVEGKWRGIQIYSYDTHGAWDPIK